MRIMHVLPELEEGGVERIVPIIANRQAGAGHVVYVVSHGGRLESLLSPAVTHIKMPVHRKTPLIGIPCALRLARFIRSENISIIHAHSRMPGWICRVARLLAPDVRYIFTVHNTYPRLNFGTWPITRADGVTCVSGSSLRSIEKWMPAGVPARVVYNPLNTKVRPWTGSGDTSLKHLLFVGRLSGKKGILFLIEALARVKNKNWVFDVIGDGPAMGALREKIAGHGLDRRVRFHGISDDVPAFISACDLFLFPSREEGLGMALVEALLSGAPVLASDLPAARELCSADGTNPNGELLPPDDTGAWAGAIGRFLEGGFSPALKLAVKLPTEEGMASAITEFYDEVLRRE